MADEGVTGAVYGDIIREYGVTADEIRRFAVLFGDNVRAELARHTSGNIVFTITFDAREYGTPACFRKPALVIAVVRRLAPGHEISFFQNEGGCEVTFCVHRE